MRRIPSAAFLIPFLLLLLGFRLVVFDAGFYKSEFEKYKVYDSFDKSVADSAVTNLISYMKSGVPLSDFFNKKEKAHMVDVKNIIQKLLALFYVLAFVVVTLLAYNRKNLFKSLFYGGIFTLILLLMFFTVAYTGFDTIFYKFHELSFSNDLWMLNPEVDNLKALLPDGFFYDALMRIFFIALASSVVITLLGFSSEKVLNILKHHF
ncbi:MAG: TIGR01906 family membrane protein [Nanoarchaeota archaeon]|nr:TIGR01906 family membrane protein [Nanoarchaeota archaeon]